MASTDNTIKAQQIILVVGSNRTGTSLLTEILLEQGFIVPGKAAEFRDYDTYECAEFKRLSRNWNDSAAREFVAGLPADKLVLKYPKASNVIDRWLELMPQVRVVYVFRPHDEAVASMIKYSWPWKSFQFIGRWLYRREWRRGLLAVTNLPVPIAFVTFADLKLNRRFDIPPSFDW